MKDLVSYLQCNFLASFDHIVGRCISSERVARVMLSVDRADFCPHSPYTDSPQDIGHNATISAPHMHAYALQHSLPALPPGSRRILDVGSGSGYLTVCYALLGDDNTVIGIDHIPELVEMSLANTARHHKDLLTSGKVRYVVGEGRDGYAEGAPYDVIHVGAAAEERPEKLLEQLAPEGLLIVPVGDFVQQIIIYKKDKMGRISERATLPVRYIPLTDRETQERIL